MTLDRWTIAATQAGRAAQGIKADPCDICGKNWHGLPLPSHVPFEWICPSVNGVPETWGRAQWIARWQDKKLAHDYIPPDIQTLLAKESA